jgi:hypothetical protein
MSSRVEAPSFDVGNYMQQRAETAPFAMIELGHGRYPLVANQPNFFTGDRTYTGIEAGMRSGLAKAEERRDELGAEYKDVNATFMVHDLGGAAVYENDDFADVHYRGGFQPQTPLPAESGDEVVASNVFGDPLVADDFGRTMGLLTEMSRLTSPQGVVILRETITPDQSSFLHESAQWYTAEYAGLQVLGRVAPYTMDWEELELFYGTHKEWAQSAVPPSEAFYLFLAKSSLPPAITGPDN